MWLAALVLVLVAVGIVMIYNGLVDLRERGDASWSDIDVQLKRRHDLIPNLVEIVKGYAAHEREALEAVTRARTSAMEARGPAARGEAEKGLAGALRSLFALSESYPQLQASGNFSELQQALTAVEDDLQRARRYYNAVTRDYNIRTRSIPSNIVARAFGFRAREFFQAEESERAAPQVRLDDSGS